METAEVLTVLLTVICLLATLAERVRAPGPILFLLGGLLLSFVPGTGTFDIEPTAILTIFLPPLLMEAAFFMPLREFRGAIIPILRLAVGLVLVTAVAVALVFHALVPGAGLAAGLVLGAIVSPPDAIAATGIIRKFRVPKRIVTILEGESLINDASGLILYKFAVAAVVTGQFSGTLAGAHFLWLIVCGPAVGWGMGRLAIWLMPRIRELSVEILLTFVAPYVSYLTAEALDGSGVLAVVTTGLYVGWHGPAVFTSQFNLPAGAVWRMVSFVMSALVFILIGLKIPVLFVHLSVYPTGQLLGYSALVCGTAIAVRFAYIFAAVYAPKLLPPRWRKSSDFTHWQNVLVVAFVGMRGVVSLATALALPLAIDGGGAFPARDLITFLALSFIVFTLVAQGLSLPWLLGRLTLHFEERIFEEDWKARVAAAREALAELDRQGKGAGTPHPAIDRIRGYYLSRLELLGDGPNTPLGPGDSPRELSPATLREENRIWRDILSRERAVVVAMRRSYEIGDQVMHDILGEIDLLAARFAG